MSYRLFMLLTALVLLPAQALAQGTIRGTVTDDTGSPLPGANVAVVGTQLGAATGVDGTYRIDGVPTGAYEVTATFVGFTTGRQQVTVTSGATATADFTLATGVELERVVVEGYRVRTVPIESGAISVVDGDQIQGLTVRAPDAALQGRAAGVRVTGASGQPGSAVEINVRGAGSITAGTAPLFIVDGVQMNRSQILNNASGNPLAAISPADIESIEVLKDAAASSIYGAQAANGVVLITTRRGRAGTTEVNFETQVGTRDRTRRFDVMNSEQYLNHRATAIQNTADEYRRDRPTVWPTDAAFFGAIGCPAAARESARACAEAFFGSPTVDESWQDLVFRTGVSQSYGLSARGGTDRTSFFASGRYTDDQGQIIASNFRQYGARVNLDHRISDRVQLETRTSLSSSLYRGTISDGAFINSPFFAAQFIPPTASLYNRPGDATSGYNLSPNSVFSYNPVAMEEFNDYNSGIVSVVGSGAVNVQIMEGLFSRTFLGLQFNDTEERRYDDPRLPQQAQVGGSAHFISRRFFDYNVSQTLSLQRALGAAGIHRVGGLLGTEFKQGTDDRNFASGRGFPNELFRTLAAAADPVNVSQTGTEYRQVSLFGDAEYTFDRTYQLRTVLRYDGSSRFGAENRFGLFGTVAGYVRLSRLPYLREVNTNLLSDLKLRASVGTTGNSDMGQGVNFAHLRLLGTGGDYAGRAGIRPTAIGNQFLTWESAREINVGLDYGLFRNRITGAIELYQQDRDDLLLNRTLANDSGFSSRTENVGAVRTQGAEFTVNTVNLSTGGFLWTSNFNISFQRGEVVRLFEGAEFVNAGGWRYQVGEAPRQYWAFRWAGVNPATGRPMYYDADGNITYRPVAADNVLAGSPDPDFFGGFGNTLSYGGVTLDALFQFDYGRVTYNNDAYFSDVTSFDWNKATRALDHWRQPGDVVAQPRPWFLNSFLDGTQESSFGFNSTRFMEDASYIRLKQLRLSYALPAMLTTPLNMRNASVFVQGENLLTWTRFTGPDPELVGTAIGRYPQARVLTTGFRVGI